jgi:hypothetical protein
VKVFFTAEKIPCHSQRQSAGFFLPPMSALVFQAE